MDNKNVFASNLNHYMKLNKVSRKQLSEVLGLSYFTVTDWVKGKKYPRMDKVEMIADYFGIKKSDLIENKEDDAEFSSELVSSLTDERKKYWDSICDGYITDDEFEKITEYLKFLVSQRGK